MILARRASERFHRLPKLSSTTSQVERSSAGVYGWLRWASLADSLGICNADDDGAAMAFEKLFPHHFALSQKMACSTESTGGLRPGTDEGSKA